MNIASAAAGASRVSPAVLRQAAPVDADGDHDNDATESVAAQRQESAARNAPPIDPNRGRQVNISV